MAWNLGGERRRKANFPVQTVALVTNCDHLSVFLSPPVRVSTCGFRKRMYRIKRLKVAWDTGMPFSWNRCHAVCVNSSARPDKGMLRCGSLHRGGLLAGGWASSHRHRPVSSTGPVPRHPEHRLHRELVRVTHVANRGVGGRQVFGTAQRTNNRQADRAGNCAGASGKSAVRFESWENTQT